MFEKIYFLRIPIKLISLKFTNIFKCVFIENLNLTPYRYMRKISNKNIEKRISYKEKHFHSISQTPGKNVAALALNIRLMWAYDRSPKFHNHSLA